MKRILVFALGASLFIGACKKNDDDDNAQPKARVMFVHGALDADSLRGRVNNVVITSVPFLGSSGYRDVDPASSTTLDFIYTGSGSLFQGTTAGIVANNSYSVFAGGSAGVKMAVVVSDNLTAPSAGKAKVRFVNMSPDNINAVAYIGNSTIDSVMMGQVSSFKEINPGAQKVTMGVLPNTDDIESFNFAAGKIYTFLFSGTGNGAGKTAITLTPFTNN